MFCWVICFLFVFMIYFFFFFFFNDTATTEIYTLSLHDALPISARCPRRHQRTPPPATPDNRWRGSDRKSTRLNSSHVSISYAVFCLKKKKKNNTNDHKATKLNQPMTIHINISYALTTVVTQESA